MASKVYPTAQAALEGKLFDGMTIMAGGFGLCGIPKNAIAEIKRSGAKNLAVTLQQRWRGQTLAWAFCSTPSRPRR